MAPTTTARPVTCAENRAGRQRPRVDGVDGLRAVAALVIGVFHVKNAWIPGGPVAVDVFFGISGFVITNVLLSDADRSGTIGLRRFYRRRLGRLMPPLALVCLAVVLVSLVTTYERFQGAWVGALLALTYLVHVARTYDLVDTGPMGHAWSLGAEEQFYLTWPLALRILLRRMRLRILLVLVAGAAAVPTLVRLVLWEGEKARIYNSLETRADGFLLGCLLALVLWGVRTDPVRLARARRLARWAAWPAVFLLAAVVVLMPIHGVWHDVWTPLWYTVGLFCAGALTVPLLALLSLDHGHAITRLLATRPLAVAGRHLSYPFYLWHFPLLQLLRDVGVPGGLPLLAAMLPSGLALSGLTYLLLERRSFRRESRPTAPRGRRWVWRRGLHQKVDTE